jgi:hypothetical protein
MTKQLARLQALVAQARERGRLRGTSTRQSELISLLVRDREEIMRKRAMANVTNAAELDEAMGKLASGSKALKFLRDRIEARGEGEDDPRPAYREIHRICGIEFVTRHSDEDRELFQEALIQQHALARGFRFKDAQIESLLTFDRLDGLFGPIGVGHGKTFITLLCAALAFQRGQRKSLLLVPPEVYPQLVTRDIPQARRDLVLFGLPFLYLGGETQRKRRAIVTSDKRGCYVMPYSLLSTTDSSFMLDHIRPELIIADEAHCLKNIKDSARAKRVKAYIEERDPHFVAVSGTITQKSVMDYWHLLLWTLGPGAVLPLTNSLACEWAAVIDSETRTQEAEADTGPLVPLIRWARKHDSKGRYDETLRGFRKAYALRLQSAPGVVKTDDASCDASILIENFDPGDPCKELDDLMEAVVQDWMTPQGEPIEFGLHKFKWLNELTAGFWHELIWPSPEKYARGHKCSVAEAADRIARAMEHHEAQKMYHSELSKWLRENHVKGLDTPMLVAAHVTRYFGTDKLRVSPLVAALYMEMKDRDFPGRPEREHRPIRVDDYKIKSAVRWAVERRHGIVWYHHNAVGDWLVERLVEAGCRPHHAKAGDAGNLLLSDDRTVGDIVVASINAHSTGKNLQFHTNQLVVQWPRPAKIIEQALGRTHRLGQEADSLTVHTNFGNTFDRALLASCLTDALYTHQSGGGLQKVVVAAWNPLPSTVPHGIMVERGIDPTNAAMAEKMMAEHFSG